MVIKNPELLILTLSKRLNNFPATAIYTYINALNSLN